MRRFWKWLKSIDYRHYICLAILLGSLACSIFAFPKTAERLIDGGHRFISAGKDWVSFIFNVEFPEAPPIEEPTDPTPPTPPAENPTDPAPLPPSSDEFISDFARYWQLIGDKENALKYFGKSGEIFFYVMQSMLIVIPAVFAAVIVLKMAYKKPVNNKRGSTKPLRAWLTVSKHTYEPVKAWVLDFANFLRYYSFWWKICLIVWLYNFNALGVILSALAFFIKFDVSFSLIATYRYIYELFIDLALFFGKLPKIVWVMIVLLWIDRKRKDRAIDRLHGMEWENLKFAKSLPIVTLFAGTVGAGKTTLVTDLSLTLSAYFRNVAKKKLLECVVRFPGFSWQELNRILRHAIRQDHIHAWWAVPGWISKKRERFLRSGDLWGYDYEKYGMTFNDGNHVWTLWEVLDIYIKMYFLYTLPTSLLISNFSIREDRKIRDQGNFPLWDTDFFNKDPEMRNYFSMHAHILDQDIVRLGKKMLLDNPLEGSFAFGIIDMTEAGKERQNDKETKEIKKEDVLANQKNDLWSLDIKMIRHPSTVDHFPFARVLMDEQRAMSVDINARDLCTIGHIREKGAERLTVKLLPPEKWLFQLLEDRFQRYYEDYIYRRGDTTLRKYLAQMIFGKIGAYGMRLKSKFGFHELLIETERGTMDGDMTQHIYYIMNAKAYADRYATDCYAEPFRGMAERSGKSINDYPTYRTVRATTEELKKQHSYFVRDVLTELMKRGQTDQERSD